MRFLLTIPFLALLACGDSASKSDTGTPNESDADADADSDADADTGTPNTTDTTTDTATTPPSLLLEQGTYTPVFVIENDTCGGMTAAFSISAVPYDLVWNSQTEFGLVDNTYGSPPDICQVDADDKVVCSGYHQNLVLAPGLTLVIDSASSAFTVNSTTSFDKIEALDFDCVGAYCAGYESDLAVTWPCSMEMLETYTK